MKTKKFDRDFDAGMGVIGPPDLAGACHPLQGQMTLIFPRLIAGFVALAAIAGCDNPQPPSAMAPPSQVQQSQGDAADTIYVGGDIVTINDKQPSADALAVKGGKILAVGARAGADLVEQSHRAFLEQAGTDAAQHIFGRLALQDHGVDAVEVK